jgi:hypothetical protein
MQRGEYTVEYFCAYKILLRESIITAQNLQTVNRVRNIHASAMI